MFYIAVYDVSGAASDRNCVVLSDIHIDIMDYIQPASCTDAEFRQMWAEFEWENKVSFFCVCYLVFLLMRYNSVSCSTSALPLVIEISFNILIGCWPQVTHSLIAILSVSQA